MVTLRGHTPPQLGRCSVPECYFWPSAGAVCQECVVTLDSCETFDVCLYSVLVFSLTYCVTVLWYNKATCLTNSYINCDRSCYRRSDPHNVAKVWVHILCYKQEHIHKHWNSFTYTCTHLFSHFYTKHYSLSAWYFSAPQTNSLLVSTKPLTLRHQLLAALHEEVCPKVTSIIFFSCHNDWKDNFNLCMDMFNSCKSMKVFHVRFLSIHK